MSVCKRLCYFSTPSGECKKAENVPCPLEAPVTVVRGHWVKRPRKDKPSKYDLVCSVCGCDDALAEHNYCPDCGAKMGVSV